MYVCMYPVTTYVSMHLSVCLSVCLSAYLTMYLNIDLFNQSIYVCMRHVPIYLSVFINIFF